MPGYPFFDSQLEAARFLVRDHRPEEIAFDRLSGAEREIVIHELRREHASVWRRMMVAHLAGASLTGCFLVLGLAVMAIGPAEFTGMFGRWLGVPALSNQGSHWIVLIALAALGGAVADYVLRGRLRIARLWSAESAGMSAAIKRGEGSVTGAGAPGNADSTAHVADAAPLLAAAAVLRAHTEQPDSHYLIERLNGLVGGEPLTPETAAAVRTVLRHLRDECGAPDEAAAVERWLTWHEAWHEARRD